MTTPDPLEPAQRAVAQRLARLRTFPVDTSRLDRIIQLELPAKKKRPWFAPIAAVAASLMIVAAVVFMMQPRPVQASPSEMVQMHLDIVSGKVHTMQVDSMDQANNALASMAHDAPHVTTGPAEHGMQCCIRDIGNKKVSCILLKNGGGDGLPVTISIARAADVKPPPNTATQTLDGVTYHLRDMDKLHMVMLTHNGNWICLISEAPASSLITLAQRLQH